MIASDNNLIIDPQCTHYVVPVTYDTVDVIKQTAIHSNFDCWLVQYNTLLFGSAANRIEAMALLLNAYFLPEKVKLPTPTIRKCVYEAVINMPNEVDDPLTEEEQAIANWLPNGYSKKTTHRGLYRPLSGAELVGKYVDEGYCILHPWIPRAMTCAEMNACLEHHALQYFDQHLAEHYSILEAANPPEFNQYDVSSKIPTCKYNLNIPRTFPFIKNVTKIDDF